LSFLDFQTSHQESGFNLENTVFQTLELSKNVTNKKLISIIEKTNRKVQVTFNVVNWLIFEQKSTPT
jgi:hypothetical protein